MENSLGRSFLGNFLGDAPKWYKLTIISFLIINPIIFFINPFVAGWFLIGEFIFTLALALKCYPLPSGGLLAIQAVILGMTSPHTVYEEVSANLPVILLLMFMVAGIYFMKEGLLYLFTKVLVNIKSKIALSLVFSLMAAFLSAFLDALTVTAVVISVGYGFYGIYHKYASTRKGANAHLLTSDEHVSVDDKKDLEQFRGFLRNILMHAAVGTALGGAMTLVGEPQNLLIGSIMQWDFIEFFKQCAAISIPVLIVGLITCVLLEVTKIAGYGYQLPANVRSVLEADVKAKDAQMDKKTIARLIVQMVAGIVLIMSLAMHLAEVGLIGLMIIILITAFNGVTDEHHFGPAFKESLPFTALLVVFFAIVAVIHDQHLFTPIVNFVLNIEGQKQLVAFFVANGVLSAISDNVFVATVYISQVNIAFQAGMFDQAWFEKLAVSVNMGTNIPSVATPNGQAAFLFLLTSSLAPLIKLSYLEMVKMAFPYAITLSATGLLATMFLL